jgi:uncharacterized membrane protein
MTLLALLILAFGLAYIFPAVPSWKTAVGSNLGKAYGPAYGIVSLVLFLAVLWSFRQIEPVALYDPPDWGLHANFALSLLGFLCLGIFAFRGSWRNALKFPMAIGVSFWALGHLLANGDQRTTLLFAGLAAMSLLHAFLKSMNVAFAPSVERQGHNGLSLLAGLVLYGLATQLHAVLSGVPVITLQ